MNKLEVMRELRTLEALGFNANAMRSIEEWRVRRRVQSMHNRDTLINAMLREGRHSEAFAVMADPYSDDPEEPLTGVVREACESALRIIARLRELTSAEGVDWVRGVREAGDAWRRVTLWLGVRSMRGAPIIEAVDRVTAWAGERADEIRDTLEHEAARARSRKSAGTIVAENAGESTRTIPTDVGERIQAGSDAFQATAAMMRDGTSAPSWMDVMRRVPDDPAGDAGDKPQVKPVMTRAQWAYLQALAEAGDPVYGADLAPKAGYGEWRKPLRVLVERGYADKPSERGGYAITDEGREALNMRP